MDNRSSMSMLSFGRSLFDKLIILLMAASALATFSSLVFLAQQAIQHDHVIGDLALRLSEFRSFWARIDPIDSDPKLGYPIWAYLMTVPFFLPASEKLILTIFVVLQFISMAAVGFLLARKILAKSLSTHLKLLILVSCMPWYALGYQAKYLNYGLIVVLGIAMYAYCESSILRIAGIVIALIKPALCLPAILLAPWLHAFKIAIAGLVVVLAQGFIAAGWMKQDWMYSMLRPLTRYVPAKAGDLDVWFLSGDYGILSKLVRTNILGEREATILLVGLLALLILFLAKTRGISRRNASTLSFLMIPLTCFHRYHDMVLIWPALVAMTIDFLSASDARRWFSFFPVLWAIHYRGAGSGSLYTIGLMLVIWIFYSPSFDGSDSSRSAEFCFE